jgi:hypothetical protein
MVIFPITGYLLAHMTGITEYGAATSFMNEFSFGGLAILGAIILTASYTALNDSNLLGTLYAAESINYWKRKNLVLLLAILGAATAGWLSVAGAASAVEAIASINCIVIPTATIVILAEWFLTAKIFKRVPIFDSRFRGERELPAVRWPAFIALVVGISAGLVTGGFIPWIQSMTIGIASINAWICAFITYAFLRIPQIRASMLDEPRIAILEAGEALSLVDQGAAPQMVRSESLTLKR